MAVSRLSGLTERPRWLVSRSCWEGSCTSKQESCRRRARRASQECSAILTTSSSSGAPTGCSASMKAASSSSNCCWFSQARTVNLPQSPWVRRFSETLALVSADLGPQDSCALRRLAAICLAVAIGLYFSRCGQLWICATRGNYWTGVCGVRGNTEVKLLGRKERYRWLLL